MDSCAPCTSAECCLCPAARAHPIAGLQPGVLRLRLHEGGTVAYTPSEAVFGWIGRSACRALVDVDPLTTRRPRFAYGKEGEIRIRALVRVTSILKIRMASTPRKPTTGFTR